MEYAQDEDKDEVFKQKINMVNSLQDDDVNSKELGIYWFEFYHQQYSEIHQEMKSTVDFGNRT